MFGLGLPLIALGLVLTLTSDLSLRNTLSRRLWWSGFLFLAAGLFMLFAPAPLLPDLLPGA